MSTNSTLNTRVACEGISVPNVGKKKNFVNFVLLFMYYCDSDDLYLILSLHSL